jgi:hypothetical protein
LPDFRGTVYPNGVNIPNGRKTYHKSAMKYTKWQVNWSNGHEISNSRLSKIYPNLEFWFENKPSGNPTHKVEYG